MPFAQEAATCPYLTSGLKLCLYLCLGLPEVFTTKTNCAFSPSPPPSHMPHVPSNSLSLQITGSEYKSHSPSSCSLFQFSLKSSFTGSNSPSTPHCAKSTAYAHPLIPGTFYTHTQNKTKNRSIYITLQFLRPEKRRQRILDRVV